MNGLLDNINDRIVGDMEQAAPTQKPWFEEIAVDLSAPRPQRPEPIFTLNGMPVVVEQGITGIVGRQKSGKTTDIVTMVASAISRKSIIGFNARPGVSIALIDNEQSRQDVEDEIDDIFYYAGQKRGPVPGLYIYSLGTDSPDELKDKVERIVREARPTVTIIDNLMNLTYDFNSTAEASSLFMTLRRLAIETNTAFVTVVHTNAGSGSEGKAMGNVGSTLHRYCYIILRNAKTEDDRFTIKCDDNRKNRFEPVTYTKDAHGHIELNDVVMGEPKSNKPMTLEDRIFAAMEPGRTYKNSELKGFVVGDSVSAGSAGSAISALCRKGLIVSIKRNCYALKTDVENGKLKID